MSEMMILVRAPIRANLEELTEYRDLAAKRLKSVKGYRGTSWWIDDRDPTQMLQVHEYDGLKAAEDGLKKLATADLPAKSRALLADPADVMRMRVLGWHGGACQTTPIGTYLSLSVRHGEPGLGSELSEDLETVFDELQVIDGYIGAVRGCNDVLEEEIVGIALWESKDAFKRSLPKKAIYEVKLYQKVL